jgi:hypothetical protein
VAYLTFAERKIIGYMQVRLGPNRVGPKGWLQPIADAMKLMFKEIIIPKPGGPLSCSVLAPVVAFGPALAAWAVVPFGNEHDALASGCRYVVSAGADFAGGLRRDHFRLGLELKVRLSWAQCARRRKSLPTKSLWALRW